MVCKNCGASYEGTGCPNGCGAAEGKKNKKPIFKKWWFWVIVAAVVITIASGGGEKESVTAGAPVSTGASQSDSGSGQVEETETTAAAADNVYGVGDVINANGLQITYVKAENYEEENMFLQPDEGYKYVRLFLLVENTSSTDKYISSFEFTCYADGKKEETYYSTTEALEGGELSAGRKTEGYIYFKVPVDAQEIEVEYETSFWTGKKAILRVDLNG